MKSITTQSYLTIQVFKYSIKLLLLSFIICISPMFSHGQISSNQSNVDIFYFSYLGSNLDNLACSDPFPSSIVFSFETQISLNGYVCTTPQNSNGQFPCSPGVFNYTVNIINLQGQVIASQSNNISQGSGPCTITTPFGTTIPPGTSTTCDVAFPTSSFVIGQTYTVQVSIELLGGHLQYAGSGTIDILGTLYNKSSVVFYL